MISQEEHEYEPDPGKSWDPCKICGHGRHHPWHIEPDENPTDSVGN